MRYREDIKDFLKANSKKYTTKELVSLIEKQYGVKLETKKLAQYLIKMKMPYKYEKPNKSHSNKSTPIGTIVNKTDGGYLKIKIGNHKWEYLQRKIYEKYHNVKLKDDEYIIFLDQNRRNFDIDNLKLVSRHESSIIANRGVYSNNKEITKLGLVVSKLLIKIKEEKNGYK